MIPLNPEKPQQDTPAPPPTNELERNKQQLLPRYILKSGTRVVHLKVFADSATVTAGDGKYIYFFIPEFASLTLQNVYAYVTTVSSSGALTIQVRNVTQSADMLATAITIDQSELSSLTAATPPAISRTVQPPRKGDQIAIDVDGAGTNAKGLGVFLTFG